MLIGENHYNVVYGGSRLGMMYACAGAVKEAGGNIIGIMPEKLANMGCANPEDCETFINKLHERYKKLLAEVKAEPVDNSKTLVEKGEWVDTGDVIGLVGNTGRSTGSHLHYEIRLNNRAINPTTFIRTKKDVFKN